MGKGQKVPVTKRALVQRINRKLAASGEAIKAARGGRQRRELGDFYRLNVNRNTLVAKDVDPEALARELGVLHPWERPVSDQGAR